jgi:hypothetical protein
MLPAAPCHGWCQIENLRLAAKGRKSAASASGLDQDPGGPTSARLGAKAVAGEKRCGGKVDVGSLHQPST